MDVLPGMFPVLTTPASVGQFVSGALTGVVAESQVTLGCAIIARACDVYTSPPGSPAVSLQPIPSDIKGLVELFKDPVKRPEVAPRMTDNAATIAAIVSAFLSAGEELRSPPPLSVPQSFTGRGVPPPSLYRRAVYAPARGVPQLPVRLPVLPAGALKVGGLVARHSAQGHSWWQRLLAFFWRAVKS